MKLLSCSTFVLATLLLASEATAQEAAASTPLDAYHDRELNLQISLFRGLRVFRGGQDTELGHFGGGYEEVFAGSEGALDEIERFQALRITGFVITMVGIAGLLAELVTILAATDLLIDDEGMTPLFLGWLLGGAVVGLTGNVIYSAAMAPLSRAVRTYNEDLHRRLGGHDSSRGRTVGLSLRARF